MYRGSRNTSNSQNFLPPIAGFDAPLGIVRFKQYYRPTDLKLLLCGHWPEWMHAETASHLWDVN